MLDTPPSLSHIMGELKNPQHLSNGTWQLLWAVKLLHRHYPQECNAQLEHIRYAFGRLNQNIRNLDVHNFRSLVSFAQKYESERAVWELYLQNVIRLILSFE